MTDQNIAAEQERHYADEARWARMARYAGTALDMNVSSDDMARALAAAVAYRQRKVAMELDCLALMQTRSDAEMYQGA